MKKKVMYMRNKEKIRKHNSLRSGILINILFFLVGFAGVVGLIWTCRATIPTVVGAYLVYRLLRLILRLIRLVLSSVFTVASIIILILIISLLIF